MSNTDSSVIHETDNGPISGRISAGASSQSGNRKKYFAMSGSLSVRPFICLNVRAREKTEQVFMRNAAGDFIKSVDLLTVFKIGQ
jgi:hypothetical protein